MITRRRASALILSIPAFTAANSLPFGTMIIQPAEAAAASNSAVANEREAYEIGREAYTYIYPLILMDATRRQAANFEAGKVKKSD